jgi:hypothetical protein
LETNDEKEGDSKLKENEKNADKEAAGLKGKSEEEEEEEDQKSKYLILPNFKS